MSHTTNVSDLALASTRTAASEHNKRQKPALLVGKFQVIAYLDRNYYKKLRPFFNNSSMLEQFSRQNQRTEACSERAHDGILRGRLKALSLPTSFCLLVEDF
jgi:hypothetical protein